MTVSLAYFVAWQKPFSWSGRLFVRRKTRQAHEMALAAHLLQPALSDCVLYLLCTIL